MACEDEVLLLHAYLDGELDLVHSLELEKHLKACAGCAQRLEDERTLKGALRAGGLYHRSPRALGERVRAAVAKETSESTTGRFKPAPSSRGPASRPLGSDDRGWRFGSE
jgi:anti-sigma factor RsiW